MTNISTFAETNKLSAIVCDMSPLRVNRCWKVNLKEKMNKDISIYEVDAHNVVPIW